MIKDLRIARDFYLGFANNPQAFITDWIASQCKDLKGTVWLYLSVIYITGYGIGMQDMSGSPDVERRSETFKEEWVSEAVMRYFYNKLQQRRAELEQAINQK